MGAPFEPANMDSAAANPYGVHGDGEALIATHEPNRNKQWR